MLQYMGSLQPPRKYPIPQDRSSKSTTTSPCKSCTSAIWTPNFYSALRAVPPDDSQFVTSYQVSSSALRNSTLDGCRWCRTLADGIHGRIFLDALYEQWEKTESWPSEGSNGEESEHEEEIKEWDTATAFNDDGDGDPTGGWNSYEDLDTLAVKCNFSIELSFERGDGGRFTFLNAHIEAFDWEEDGVNSVQKVSGEKAVDMRYHVNMSGVKESLTEPFPLTVINTVLGSESNLKTICDWLQKSDRLSPSPDKYSLTIPSRLIDVSNGSLCIVETSEISCHESERLRGFAALSYVWGTSQTFILLSSTKDELMSSFDIQKLPQTIQDAIAVARRIGYRYIWVDALCIMQDSDADKSQELPKMRQIYQSASITIVAAVSKTATEGFLHIPIETSYFIDPIAIPYHLEDKSASAAELILSYPASYERRRDPINDRAWTYQEYLLPTRLISFSYRGIETIDRGNVPDANGLTSGKDAQLPNTPWHGNFYNLNPDGENLRQRWLSTRDEYSRRRLTYPGDKLVAIAAVAEEIGRAYKSRHLAGLWERDLELDLQWARTNPGFADGGDGKWPHLAEEIARHARAAEYVAPSWSWASIQGEIEDRASDVERKTGGECLDFSIVRCEVELALPGFSYGAVKSGTLVVQGRLHSFFWRPERDRKLMTCDGYLAVRGETDPHPEMQVGEVWIDALDPELMDGCVVDCLAMSLVERVPGREEVEGIVLLPVDDTRHRRVGYFKVSAKVLYDDVEAMEVTII
ncbi:HET-domain-containing protein [Melanomma pulvis-pyrius CBS 109.77]|uniref:HET-domain-containing protein n=1 Tax=Melanomma pulvis-pyrius CBS 109.77 TaxID=1314802 RepID=A0A6A6XRH5_9PLEO|nr:HET-domain-containing protein [Melanomma pulvis-pyrius CBS 109.77]